MVKPASDLAFNINSSLSNASNIVSNSVSNTVNNLGNLGASWANAWGPGAATGFTTTRVGAATPNTGVLSLLGVNPSNAWSNAISQNTASSNLWVNGAPTPTAPTPTPTISKLQPGTLIGSAVGGGALIYTGPSTAPKISPAVSAVPAAPAPQSKNLFAPTPVSVSASAISSISNILNAGNVNAVSIPILTQKDTALLSQNPFAGFKSTDKLDVTLRDGSKATMAVGDYQKYLSDANTQFIKDNGLAVPKTYNGGQTVVGLGQDFVNILKDPNAVITDTSASGTITYPASSATTDQLLARMALGSSLQIATTTTTSGGTPSGTAPNYLFTVGTPGYTPSPVAPIALTGKSQGMTTTQLTPVQSRYSLVFGQNGKQMVYDSQTKTYQPVEQGTFKTSNDL